MYEQKFVDKGLSFRHWSTKLREVEYEILSVERRVNHMKIVNHIRFHDYKNKSHYEVNEI